MMLVMLMNGVDDVDDWQTIADRMMIMTRNELMRMNG